MSPEGSNLDELRSQYEAARTTVRPHAEIEGFEAIAGPGRGFAAVTLGS